MTKVWLDPGSHGVGFYEGESSTYDSIADFFTAGVDADDPLLLVSRRETFDAVAGLLAAGRYGPPVEADRIHFVDAEAALAQVIDAGALDPARVEALFKKTIGEIRHRHPGGTVRFFGETVDLLCERGQFDAAVEIEEIASNLFAFEPRLSILCGYALSHFRDGANASQFRAICGSHTHGASGGAAAGPPAQGKPLRASEPPSVAVYVIDDDPSIRRSLERLLSLTEWRVMTFESAEAFLAALDGFSPGCLIVDIQLGGMSGLALLDAMKTKRPTWPAIAMSGSHNDGAEREALRLGARAFLHKPFDPQSLLDAITLALA